MLNQVRFSGTIGRAEVARACGLSTQAVSNIISDLMEDGMISELGRRASSRGQPPVQYALNPEGGYALGIEIRPDVVLAAVLDLCGNQLASKRQKLTATCKDGITSTVVGLANSICVNAGLPKDKILGAGIVMPGPFGETGIRDTGTELPSWEPAKPDVWFSNALDLPVFVENDANAAAMAEMVNGVAKNLNSFAFIFFGNGIGLGVVEHGKLLTGVNGNAGEIGHIPVISNGKQVSLESTVSRLSVHRHLTAAGVNASSTADLDRLCLAKDASLNVWLESALEPLSNAITVVENLFDPATIIFGGAMPKGILDYFIEHVQFAQNSVSERADRPYPRLQRGASGRLASTMGAAALALNQTFTPKFSSQY